MNANRTSRNATIQRFAGNRSEADILRIVALIIVCLAALSATDIIVTSTSTVHYLSDWHDSIGYKVDVTFMSLISLALCVPIFAKREASKRLVLFLACIGSAFAISPIVGRLTINLWFFTLPHDFYDSRTAYFTITFWAKIVLGGIPLIVFLVYAAKTMTREANGDDLSIQVLKTPPTGSSSVAYGELSQFVQLHRDGVITDEEFANAKAKLRSPHQLKCPSCEQPYESDENFCEQCGTRRSDHPQA